MHKSLLLLPLAGLLAGCNGGSSETTSTAPVIAKVNTCTQTTINNTVVNLTTLNTGWIADASNSDNIGFEATVHGYLKDGSSTPALLSDITPHRDCNGEPALKYQRKVDGMSGSINTTGWAKFGQFSRELGLANVIEFAPYTGADAKSGDRTKTYLWLSGSTQTGQFQDRGDKPNSVSEFSNLYDTASYKLTEKWLDARYASYDIHQSTLNGFPKIRANLAPNVIHYVKDKHSAHLGKVASQEWQKQSQNGPSVIKKKTILLDDNDIPSTLVCQYKNSVHQPDTYLTFNGTVDGSGDITLSRCDNPATGETEAQLDAKYLATRYQ